MRDSYLVYGRPQILEDEIDEVLRTLRSGWLGTGPRVAEFEDSFGEYIGAPCAVAVNSCTAALHLALITLGLQPGDEVIVPAMTFPATANAVIHAGGIPVLADVDRATLCLDPASVEAMVTARTRAVIPVHFGGRPCDMDRLDEVASEHGLQVIEDAAHAVEAIYQGRHVGTLGDIAAFSFYVTKNVVTGEGGMIATADPTRAARIKTLALHGLSADAWRRFSDTGFKHYDVVEPGFKYNMTDIQAALGVHQLARVEANLIRRQQIWATYDEALRDLPVFLPAPEEPGTRHARHLYALLVDLESCQVSRDEVIMSLHRQNIGSGVHYRSIHLHKYYRERFEYKTGDFPNAAWISERTFSLPLSPQLTDVDIDDVITALHRTFGA